MASQVASVSADAAPSSPPTASPSDTSQCPTSTTRDYVKSSAVWGAIHVVPEDSTKVFCTLCEKKLARGDGSTGNLNKHMKQVHPEEWKLLQSGQPLPGRPATQNQIDRAFLKLPPCTPSAVRQAIVNFLVSGYHSMETVEEPAFQHLIKLINPSVEIPSDTTARRDVLALYEQRKEKVKSILARVEHVSITCDVWTSPNKRSVLGVTVHFVEGAELRSFPLVYHELQGSHTGEAIAEAIIDIVKDHGIDGKLVAIACDNASNMDVAVNLVDQRLPAFEGHRVRCMAHVLHLAVMDLLNVHKPFFKRVKSFVKHTKSGHVMLGAWRDACKAINKEPNLLVTSCKTRWGSSRDMTAGMVEYRQAVNFLVSQLSDLEKLAWTFQDSEWDMMSTLLELLGPFQTYTEEVGAEKNCTINKVIALYDFAFAKLNAFKDHEVLGVGVRAALAKLRKYTEALPTIYYVAMVLDPTYKIKYFAHASSIGLKGQEFALKAVKDYMLLYGYTPAETASPTVPAPAPTSALSAHMHKRIRVDSPVSRDELTLYLEEALAPANTDPLAYWALAQLRFGTLAKVAFKVLGIPASSVPCERFFSQGRHAVDDFKHRKNVDMLCAEVCLKGWSKLPELQATQ